VLEFGSHVSLRDAHDEIILFIVLDRYASSIICSYSPSVCNPRLYFNNVLCGGSSWATGIVLRKGGEVGRGVVISYFLIINYIFFIF